MARPIYLDTCGLKHSVTYMWYAYGSEYPIFTKDTVIDCNRVFEKTSQTLIEKLDQNKLKVCKEIMPDMILQKLVKGISASTQISEKIKRMLSEI